MTLHARVSRFFLGTLALVLVGFSTILYAVSERYLHRRTDDRVDSILDTLAAAVEISPEGVEWEPDERSLSFGRRTPEGGLQWSVSDERGATIDGSTPRTILPGDHPRRSLDGRRAIRATDARGNGWAVGLRVISPETAGFDPAPVVGEAFHPALILRAAVATAEVEASLRNLGLLLAAASLAVWGLAFLGGRRLVRRALLPLTEMARVAQEIRGDDLSLRLPTSRTGDELEDLGGSFNAMLARVQESFERQRRFTGDASHQFRTPLTAIQGQVDLALRREREPAEYRRTLELVQRKTRHLRRIVESLLFLARADHDSRAPTIEAVDLAEWLPDHLRAWTEPPRSAEILLDPPGESPMAVAAQPALLAELVDNLVDNATRHGGAGTPVTVGLARLGGRIELSVEDRGPGVSAADLPHLFEPFHQTEEARKRGAGGVGLGLSIVKRLSELFGASVSAAGEPGRGARFVVSFPEAATAVEGSVPTTA